MLYLKRKHMLRSAVTGSVFVSRWGWMREAVFIQGPHMLGQH